MLDLLATLVFYVQWGFWILLGVAAICALGAAALWCWATSIRYEDIDEE